MAKTRSQKENSISSLANSLKSTKSAVFANFQGLTVKDSEELRQICRKAGVGVIASKKTVVRIALKEAGQEVDTKSFDGGVAVFLGKDETEAAKIVADFKKTHDIVKIFGGLLEGNYVPKEQVEALAKLPSKQELLQKLVMTMNNPVSGFVNVLAGNMRNLVNVLNAVRDQKQS
jgi:large subunit ribosomal protein L10